jgi:hypothetical protein
MIVYMEYVSETLKIPSNAACAKNLSPRYRRPPSHDIPVLYSSLSLIVAFLSGKLAT